MDCGENDRTPHGDRSVCGHAPGQETSRERSLNDVVPLSIERRMGLSPASLLVIEIIVHTFGHMFKNSSKLPASPMVLGVTTSFVKTCHRKLAEVETSLRSAAVRANVLNQDETGLRVGKEGWWVHVCSTDRLTYYAAHPSRGRIALDAIGIAPAFRGTSVHDRLQSYQSYYFTQALCNVHHLRELTFVEEEPGQAWASKMKKLLLEMKAEVERAKAAGKARVGSADACPLVMSL